MQKKDFISIDEILVRGSDLLKSKPNFALVGRNQELIDISAVLMKMRKRNLVVTGRGGVGISALVLGLQASKDDLKTPVDIVSKRFYWLDTDKLFESGNHEKINDLFRRVRQVLVKTKNTILVLEDTVDFIRSAQHTGCMNLINCLMGDLKSGKYQAILESKDDTVGEILKCDGDILEFCSLYEVKEPNLENLELIVREGVKELITHHGIGISEKALSTAIMLTERYKLPELRAQPDSSITLLDHVLTDRSRRAHSNPPRIEEISNQIFNLEKSANSDEISHLKEKLTEEELRWKHIQVDIRSLYRDMSDGESEIRKLEDEIEAIKEMQFENARTIENSQDANQNSKNVSAFSNLMTSSNVDVAEVSTIKEKIKKLEIAVEEASQSYKTKVQDVYLGLEIEEADVLKTFSMLSGIPVDKLSENEREKLRNLDSDLSTRVVGQNEPTLEVAKAVKRSRLGLKMPNKPSGTFMFLGPSGVGKTELAKALASSLDVPLLRFDMSEYMEKHAVAKLIGAPPGYEGFENGGILTNAARRNPYSVVLFDEIEKAHPDVYNVMLQLLDDARLTDSRGLTASFKDTIIIMTTNIGTLHFLDENLAFNEAKDLAINDLRAEYRPEFLGRFGGNIYCFKRLELEVLTQIARKDINRINMLIKDQGLSIELADEDLILLIQNKYLPREGARSILGFIDRNITSGIADVVLGECVKKGKIKVVFEVETQSVKLIPIEASSEK